MSTTPLLHRGAGQNLTAPVENQPRLLQTRRLNFRSSKLVTLNGKPERTDFQPVGNSSRTLGTKL